MLRKLELDVFGDLEEAKVQRRKDTPRFQAAS
jgi:hypothetical protein